MKISTLLILCIVFVIPYISLADTDSSDRYFLLEEACKHHDAPSYKDNPTLCIEYLAVYTNGGVISSSVSNLLDKETRAFDLVKKAAKQQTWSLPDIHTLSATSAIPHLKGWVTLNEFASIEALRLLQAGDTQMCFDLLNAFNNVGVRLSTSGVAIAPLLHMACRKYQYPVLLSAIELMPEQDLTLLLNTTLNEYRQLPSIEAHIEGQLCLYTNTIKEFFEDIRNDPDFQATQLELMKELQEAGVDEDIVSQIKNEEMLSIPQWEYQVLANLEMLHNIYTKMYIAPAEDLHELGEAFDAQVEEFNIFKSSDDTLSTLCQMMNNMMAQDKLQIQEAENLHAKIGQQFSYILLGMLANPMTSFVFQFREGIARERLYLIYIASKLYLIRNGESPSNLQQLVDNNLLTEDIILDPLSGKPFLIQGTETFGAYSIGMDLDDDKGVIDFLSRKDGDIRLIPIMQTKAVLTEPLE